MAIGPVQLIVLGFDHPDFHGEIIAELERLRDSDMVRVIDSIAVYKDADGELEVEHLSNLTEQEAIELGSKIGALIGLGVEGEEGVETGAVLGAEQAAADGIQVFAGAEEWDVLGDIPNNSAAALILLEHHWAVPLRDAIARAGGCCRQRRRRTCMRWSCPARPEPDREGESPGWDTRREAGDVRIAQGRTPHVQADRSPRFAPSEVIADQPATSPRSPPTSPG
jgi:uncharacterized membrane protein